MFYGTNQPKRDGGQGRLAEEMINTAAAAKDDVVAAAQEVLNQAQAKLTAISARGQKTGQQVDAYAREHLWTTVALAAAAGAIIGAFLSRDRR